MKAITTTNSDFFIFLLIFFNFVKEILILYIKF